MIYTSTAVVAIYARVSDRKMVITRRTKVRQDRMLDALTRPCDGVPSGRDEVKTRPTSPIFSNLVACVSFTL